MCRIEKTVAVLIMKESLGEDKLDNIKDCDEFAENKGFSHVNFELVRRIISLLTILAELLFRVAAIVMIRTL